MSEIDSSTQLNEALASISAMGDRASALNASLEFLVASINAEIGALVFESEVLTAVGMEYDDEVDGQLIDIVAEARSDIETDELSVEHTFVMPMHVFEETVSIIIGRDDGGAFTALETALVADLTRLLADALDAIEPDVEVDMREPDVEDDAEPEFEVAAEEAAEDATEDDADHELDDAAPELSSDRDDASEAGHDAVAELVEREMFMQRVEAGLTNATMPSTVGVLFIKLNEFDNVVAMLGGTAGDVLLQTVSSRLRHCVRHGDVIGQIEGDVFGLLADSFGYDDDVLSMLAGRIAETVKKPFFVYGRQVFLEASVGVAVNTTSDETAADLLHQAEVAVEAARVEHTETTVFSEDLEEELEKRAEIATELPIGLNRGELELQFVPVIALATNKLIGFESQLHWNHPLLDQIKAESFIAEAETAGLAGVVDKWVVVEACRQVGEWKRRFRTEPSIGINLTVAGMMDEDFVDNTLAALKSNGVSPSSLVIELPEAAFTDAPIGFDDRVLELREAGLKFAVDNFGTGSTSVTELHRLPVDMVKLDSALVNGTQDPANAAVLLRAVLAIGESLGLEVIAVGIEVESQRRALAEMGFEVGQGALFDVPLDGRNATEVLRSTLDGAPYEALPQLLEDDRVIRYYLP